jgi:hypothetical protein
MASRLTLSLFIGPVAIEPAPRAVMEALTEVSVQVNASDRSAFDLKFATSKDSLINTQLLPGGYFDPPSRVVIAATLNGVTSVLMDGVITTLEVVPSDQSGGSVLSVKGEDLTRMMDLIDLTGFPFFGLPDFGQIDLILLKYLPIYKIVPLILPSVLLDVPDPLERIPTQLGTDLAHIKLLGDRVGYTFFLQPGPVVGMSLAYWGPKLTAPIPFLPAPTPLAIDWDGSSNIESLQFSFDGFKKTQFIVWLKVSGVPIPLPIPVPDVTPLSPPLGRKNPLPLKITPLAGLAKYTPIQAAGIALAKASEAANIISGSGSLDVLRYGSILNARTVVSVRGAGITFDGDYYVESCSHTIKNGSYKQSFNLIRNRLIAGGSLLDAASGLVSTGQELAGFATSAVTSVSQPLGSSVLPGGGLTGLGGPLLPANATAAAGSIVSSLPASPSV